MNADVGPMPTRPMGVPATISVSHLTIVSPAGVTLLRDVSLSVAPGEVVVIVGPSGSGKTSLIRLLCGLLQREAGGWEVTGTLRASTQTIDLSRGDSQIGGMVFQNHALFDDLNAGENLRIVADHTTGDIQELSRNTGRDAGRYRSRAIDHVMQRRAASAACDCAHPAVGPRTAAVR